jgi:hypothetical protein
MVNTLFATPPPLAPWALKLVVTVSLAAPTACSDDAFRLGGRKASGGDFSQGGQPFDGGNGSGGGASIDTESSRDSGDASCAEDTYEKPGLPVDIVIAVDTSPSMAEEVAALESRLGRLRDLLAQSQITPHIILLAASSDGTTPGLCVPQPTGSGLCSPQGADSRVPEFFHHPRAVARNALEVLYDEYPTYAPYLRSDSHKTFMVVSDADAAGDRYRSADAFIADFDALDPSLLRDWRMVSIHAGSLCPSAISIGHVYADIVGRRGYFTGDLCSSDWDSLLPAFARLAKPAATDVICSFVFPGTPPVESRATDPTRMSLRLETLDGASEILPYVITETFCDATTGGWYTDPQRDPFLMFTCPATCQRLWDMLPGERLVISNSCSSGLTR